MFDHLQGPRKKIAVIGGGISGLSAAYYLAPYHDVTIYEAEPRLGGHARTVLAGRHGNQPVDTGFIVFNYATYPFLTRLFKDLDVPVVKSEMSFGATIDNGRIEYGVSNLRALVAQKRNLMRPQFYKMVADILKFGKEAERTVRPDQTIGELIEELGLSRWFRDNYLLPMSGAIWSTPMAEIDQFPAAPLVRFFNNHALMAGAGRHQWWTVDGGSIEYVKRLENALVARGCTIHRNTPVQSVERDPLHVRIATKQEGPQSYHDVIFATHSDQALKILGRQATPHETRALGRIKYQPNRAVLHCDPAQMPRNRACWSSWTYRSQKGAIGVTYWMNRLQNIPETDPLFVTLNPTDTIPAGAIYDDVTFDHPVFDSGAAQAVEQLRQIQGHNNTWFAGAYHRHGFHEDGIASAMRIVRKINAENTMGDMTDALYRQNSQTQISI